MDIDNRKKLFAVIRRGMGETEETIQISVEDCRYMMDFGIKQSIDNIIYFGLKKMVDNDDMLKPFNDIWHKDVFMFAQKRVALVKICSVFDKAGIPYILLKGAVLCDLYPNQYLRSCGDIDILVREKDIELAVQMIEQYTSFKQQKRSYHDISLVDAYVHLELHFSIKENEERIDFLLAKAWEYAVPSEYGNRYMFTPEYQVFHIVAHMVYHFLHGGIGIRPFLDLWLLANKTKYDEQVVRDMFNMCGIMKFYEVCLRLSGVWMGKNEHTNLTKKMEEFCLSGGIFGSSHFQAAVRQRYRRGLNYFFSRMFPNPYEVKEFYKDGSGKIHCLPYYYFKRFISWFRKDARTDLKRQIQDIIHIESDYVDKVEELCKELGL